MNYALINYFDVWGNEKDGYEINDQCVEAENLYIDNNATDKQILGLLKTIDFLKTDDMRRVRIEDLGEDMEIYACKNRYPLGMLRRRY